jgi:hypothetical protein
LLVVVAVVVTMVLAAAVQEHLELTQHFQLLVEHHIPSQ